MNQLLLNERNPHYVKISLYEEDGWGRPTKSTMKTYNQIMAINFLEGLKRAKKAYEDNPENIKQITVDPFMNVSWSK